MGGGPCVHTGGVHDAGVFNVRVEKRAADRWRNLVLNRGPNTAQRPNRNTRFAIASLIVRSTVRRNRQTVTCIFEDIKHVYNFDARPALTVSPRCAWEKAFLIQVAR